MLAPVLLVVRLDIGVALMLDIKSQLVGQHKGGGGGISKQENVSHSLHNLCGDQLGLMQVTKHP